MLELFLSPLDLFLSETVAVSCFIFNRKFHAKVGGAIPNPLADNYTVSLKNASSAGQAVGSTDCSHRAQLSSPVMDEQMRISTLK